MIEISFHKELYDGFAVDQATKVYERFGAFELVDEAHRWLVRLTARDPAREARIGFELSNYALGLTIDRWNAPRSATTEPEKQA
jgi:hypothetical protein